MEKLFARSGSKPMMMNSDVPIPNAATASARSDLRIPLIFANFALADAREMLGILWGAEE
jgi:hypothetical protein